MKTLINPVITLPTDKSCQTDEPLCLTGFYIMKEIWKDIPGYEKLYQVSNLGKVKSLDKYLNRNGTYVLYKGKLKKQTLNKKGYLCVTLCSNKSKRTIETHYLVAIAFLNYLPKKGVLICDHIDENPLNNKLNNLQIISVRENTAKSYRKRFNKLNGASFRKSLNKYVSTISLKNKDYYLGLFKTENEAHEAYLKALDYYENNGIMPKKIIKTSSKYTGVCFVKGSGKWRAMYNKNNKRHFVGEYENEEKAFLELKKHKKLNYGEY